MKKLLIISLLPLYCFSQDSTAIRSIARLEKGIEEIKINLQHSHGQFRAGTICAFIGLATTGASILIKPTENQVRHTSNVTNNQGTVVGTQTYYTTESDYTVKNIVAIAGGFLSLLGVAFWVDSHRYIGKAARWKYSGDKITYSF